MPVERNISPAKNKSTEAPSSRPKKAPAIDSNVTLLRSSTCHSLSLKSILKYELGTDPEGSFWLRLAGNSGSGFFSDEWISWAVIEDAPVFEMHQQLATNSCQVRDDERS